MLAFREGFGRVRLTRTQVRRELVEPLCRHRTKRHQPALSDPLMVGDYEHRCHTTPESLTDFPPDCSTPRRIDLTGFRRRPFDPPASTRCCDIRVAGHITQFHRPRFAPAR